MNSRQPSGAQARVKTRASFPVIVPSCQHIKANGIQCGSPALRSGRFCYFHQQWRNRNKRMISRARHCLATTPSPLLEDAKSIQLALSEVVQQLLARQIDNKTAGMILYALHTAAFSLIRDNREPVSSEHSAVNPRDLLDALIAENARQCAVAQKRQPDEGGREQQPANLEASQANP